MNRLNECLDEWGFWYGGSRGLAIVNSGGIRVPFAAHSFHHHPGGLPHKGWVGAGPAGEEMAMDGLKNFYDKGYCNRGRTMA